MKQLTMMEALTVKTMCKKKLKRDVRWYLDLQEKDQTVLADLAAQSVFELERIIAKMDKIIDPPAIKRLRRNANDE